MKSNVISLTGLCMLGQQLVCLGFPGGDQSSMGQMFVRTQSNVAPLLDIHHLETLPIYSGAMPVLSQDAFYAALLIDIRKLDMVFTAMQGYSSMIGASIATIPGMIELFKAQDAVEADIISDNDVTSADTLLVLIAGSSKDYVENIVTMLDPAFCSDLPGDIAKKHFNHLVNTSSGTHASVGGAMTQDTRAAASPAI